MEYEINPRGVLKISRNGLYTCFEAEVPGEDKLLRLYVKGEGRTASLGVMETAEGKAVLSKSLSRMERSKLPGIISGAFTLPYDCLPREKPEEEKRKASAGQEKKRESSDFWTALPDGSLIGRGREYTYLALPARLKTKPPGIRLISLSGQEYLVFRY